MQRAAWCNKHKLKNDQGSNFYLLHLKKRKREEKRKKEIAVEGVIAFSLQLLFLHIIPIDSRKSVLHYLWARKSSPLQFRTSFAFYSLKRISERYVGLVAEGGGGRKLTSPSMSHNTLGSGRLPSTEHPCGLDRPHWGLKQQNKFEHNCNFLIYLIFEIASFVHFKACFET